MATEEVKMEEEDPIMIRGNNDSLRGSMVDRKRPNQLKNLITKHRTSIRQIFTEMQEENGIEMTSPLSSDYKRHEASLFGVFRNVMETFQNARDRKKDFNVEVRLQDVSYHVPVRTGIFAGKIRTVYNMCCCYQIFRMFKRFFVALGGHAGSGDYGRLFQPFEKKKVLHNANLVFKPGHSYLILGPPQCGKTTLLKVIAGLVQDVRDMNGHPKLSKPHISGRVSYNGLTTEEAPEMVLENVVSFIEQLDNHEPLLTVKETFDFAYECRSKSKHGTDTDINSGLSINGLGLKHVSDTFVGNANIRGCSGGQRRRVTVGEMMQGFSPVSCSDEISTGLDSSSTFDMIRSIVFFARASQTTSIVSLLQPGPETFSLFEEVVVMAEGYIIYAGPIIDVLDYFEDIGYNKPDEMDVADFLQTVSTGDGADMLNPTIRTDGHLTAEQFASQWNSSQQAKHILDEMQTEIPTRWSVDSAPNGDAENPASITPLPDQMKVQYHNSFWRSFVLVLNRFLTIWLRNKGFIIGKVAEKIGMSAMLGSVLLQNGRIDFECDPNDPKIFGGNADNIEAYQKLINGIYGTLFMALFTIAQGCATDISQEVAYRGIYYKQANANFFQASSFIFGRLVSTFPQRAIETVMFTILVYFMVGFDYTFGSLILHVMLMFLCTIVINLLFSILVMALPDAQRVAGFSLALLLLMSLLGGYLVNEIEISWALKWAFWINPFYWAMQGLASIEFTSKKYNDTSTCVPIDKYLKVEGFLPGRAMIGWSFLVMISLIILCAVVLVWVSKNVYHHKNSQKTTLAQTNDDEEVPHYEIPFTKINLTFENISYEVKSSKGGETLKLLDNVSGALIAGRMCALMGSSGAGKTTLMDVISLRKVSGEVTGTVELNGFAQEKTSFLRSSGYVEQFDIQSSQLTVFETVLFSARLRLDSRTEGVKDDASKQLFVKSIIDMLELTPIINQQVGELEFKTGLTFEQRKRLAIAVELAASPSILFLDEPTSGLDARGALIVMRAMKRIADSGRTICATIHQPSLAVFDVFDDLLLLGKGGQQAFFGDVGEHSNILTSYFESYGCTHIKFGENPASWVLKVTEKKEASEWKGMFKSSQEYRALLDKIGTERESLDPLKKISFSNDFPTTQWERLWFMVVRVHKIYFRSPSYILTRMVLSSFLMGVVFGYCFFVKDGDFITVSDNIWTVNELRGVFGVLFFQLVINGVTFIVGVIPMMKKIRDVFYKHRASGIMTHLSVASAVILVELPYILATSLIFTLIFLSGRMSSFWTIKSFFKFYGFTILNAANYTFFGQLFICLVNDIPTSMALAGAIIGTNLFGSGFIVNPKYGKTTFLPTYYISPGRYAYEGLVWSLFDGADDLIVKTTIKDNYHAHLGCGADVCESTAENFASWFFGDKFTVDNQVLDGCVSLAYVALAVIGLYFSLWKFNYVNT